MQPSKPICIFLSIPFNKLLSLKASLICANFCHSSIQHHAHTKVSLNKSRGDILL